MYDLPLPDLSVQIARRRRRCVLDPNLALSRYGAMLTRLLAPYAELWVGPEHFTILDSAQLYQHEPELLVWPRTDKDAIAEVPEMLRDWTRLRDEAGQFLHWLGDAWRESCVPDDIHESVHPRCEAASRSLDLCLPRAIEATGPLIAAMRDTAALCAVLRTACVLSLGAQDEPPIICRHLQQWGLACDKLPPENTLVGIERAGFLQLLVQAGLAPLLWGGLRLAVVHLYVPHVGRLDVARGLETEDEPALLPDEEEASLSSNPWEGSQCRWYDLITPSS
jgi:hypothetical protein